MGQNEMDPLKNLIIGMAEQKAIDAITKSGMSDFEKQLISGLVTHQDTTVKLNENSSLTIGCDKPGLKFNFECKF